MTSMKQIIFLPFALLLFTFFNLHCVFAQKAKTVLTVASIQSTPSIHKLSTPKPNLQLANNLSLPIYRVPVSMYKKYMIRVKQTEERLLRQVVDQDSYKMYSAKSAEHDGYDYYLSAAFQRKENAEFFMKSLPANLSVKAILVRMEPHKLKCNCFGKF